MQHASYNSSPKLRKERRVSFVFRRSDGPEHCAGINSLALSESTQQLWTASRDSLVKRWSLEEGGEPQLEANYEGHVDWVNDLALLGELLVSCSSDRMLRVWSAQDEGRCIATLRSHTDYVTCLAASPSAGMLASGGLRGEVMLWDINTLNQVLKSPQDSPPFAPVRCGGVKESVYAVAMDARGALVAAGSTDASITLLDARSGSSTMQLKGHTDNVRALALNAEGTLLLSGSSDHTLRLWDLGQQRCLHTFAVHTDSVWALAVDDSFGVVYSGGRDNCVYRTQLGSRLSELLLVESQPVRKLAVSSSGDAVWVATHSSTLNKWALDPHLAPASTPRAAQAQQQAQQAQQQQHVFPVPPSTVQRARMSFEGGESTPPAQQVRPAVSLRGLPPLRHASVLTDRRHVLTADEAGRVQLWDITAGAVVRDFGLGVSLKEVERELFNPTHSVSPWFTLDTKLGNLAGHMETPGCFLAEVYGQDLGFSDAPPDLKINFGEHMLRALFRGWAERWAERHFPQQHSGGGSAAGGGSGPSSARSSTQQEHSPPQSPAATAAQQQGGGGEEGGYPDANSVDDGGADSLSSPRIPTFHIASQVPPVIMVSGGDGTPWRRSMQDFDGSEAEGSVIPQWVADCVIRGQYPIGKELKTAFQLMPLEASGLPSMLQSKLNAPRVLRVNKVADYIMKKMSDQGLALREEPLFWDAAKQQDWEEQQAAAAREQRQQRRHEEEQYAAAAAAAAGGGSFSAGPNGSRFSIRQLYGGAPPPPPSPPADLPLLITCNGMVVPWDFSLAAVKQWIWKRSDDLVLNYSIRQPDQPLRLPKIRPPS